MRFIPKIATIKPKIAAIFIFFKQGLINKIPNEGPRHMRVIIEKLNVLIQATDTIAHRMSIFTNQNR